jgi:hypothetical protein
MAFPISTADGVPFAIAPLILGIRKSIPGPLLSGMTRKGYRDSRLEE